MNTNDRIHVWIDCDPGIDDAVMLALAAANRDRLDIRGISTVAGNQTSDRVTDNAVKLTHLLGAEEIPVARGARGPLTRAMIDAGDIHGESGLGYSNMPLPEADVHPNGIVAMLNAMLTVPNGEPVTLVATGPLTNVALLLSTFPEVKGIIDQIVLMGGAARGGNVTACAEFNIWEDPEAAKIVFASGLPIVMCGLDVTRYCFLTPEQISDLQQSEGKIATEYGKMLSFYLDTTKEEGAGNVIVHDASTILYLLEPHLFSGTYCHVDVECQGELTRGMTVCDPTKEGSVLVLNRADTEVFQQRVMDAIALFDVL